MTLDNYLFTKAIEAAIAKGATSGHEVAKMAGCSVSKVNRLIQDNLHYRKQINDNKREARRAKNQQILQRVAKMMLLGFTEESACKSLCIDRRDYHKAYRSEM